MAMIVVKLVTPKVGVKHEYLFNKPAAAWQQLQRLAQQSVTKYIAINLAAPKAGAKHEYLFNEPASGVTKFITIIAMKLVTF